jgi:hypothetical protein
MFRIESASLVLIQWIISTGPNMTSEDISCAAFRALRTLLVLVQGIVNASLLVIPQVIPCTREELSIHRTCIFIHLWDTGRRFCCEK